MKSRAFPKLDRRKAACPLQGRILGAARAAANPPRTARAPVLPVDEKTWIAWRMQLGASRKEARRLWRQYQRWQREEAQNPRARILSVRPWQDWEREFRAFLDRMPRKPYPFLARVARAQKEREQRALIAARKAKGRKRYDRHYERGSAKL